MARTQYSPQFKTKLVLEVLGGEKELGTIAYENNTKSQYAAKLKTGVAGSRERSFRESEEGRKAGAEKGGKPEERNRPDAENHRTADAGA